MINWQELTINKFVEELQLVYERTYGDIDETLGRVISWWGRLALENIANSDALYHDLDHTVMVSLAGQAIIEGKHLRDGGITPRDWMHFMIAVLCHDIGYIKGVCRNDREDAIATGVGDAMVKISPAGTDAALAPYHVDRSKLFVKERFAGSLMQSVTSQVDADLIASYIELTRFPAPDDELHKDTTSLAGLVRAADFIGQLGDPDYLRKVPALFYEFEELGMNQQFGYKSPHDMRTRYASFYWNSVHPYIQDALPYLRMTEDGKQWIANMHSHVLDSEHGIIKG